MAMRTIADVFDPVGVALKAEQVKSLQQQRQQAELLQQQRQQQSQKVGEFQNFLSGNQLQAQTPIQPVPQVSQEQIGLSRGESKIKNIMPSLQKNIASGNFENIEKLGRMAREDSNIHDYIRANTQLENIDIGADPKELKAWVRYTGYFTKDQLIEISQTPGGDFLRGLPEGKYTIEFDPVKKRLRPFLQQPDSQAGGSIQNILDDKDFTRNDALKYKAFGTPGQQKLAGKFFDTELEQKQKSFDLELKQQQKLVDLKFGSLTPEATKLVAKNALFDLKSLSKLISARGPNKIRAVNEMQVLAEKSGLKMPDISGRRTGFNATVRSFNKQKLAFDATEKTANEFLRDADRVLNIARKIRLNAPSLVTKTIRQAQAIAANPGLGEEAILAQEMLSLSSAFMRTALDASETISELSSGSQKTQAEMNNVNSPLFVIEKRINNQKVQVRDKVLSRSESLDKLRKQLRKFATFDERKKEPKEVKTIRRQPGESIAEYLRRTAQ
ncbi:MAG: hypothetical protein GY928_20650 [Colwellia sp.]|nr:hypothetical protein [Colwellia sp.]